MTAKEKAQELVTKFRKYASGDDDDYRFSPAIEKENAKQCALIAVDEIISFIEDDRIGFNWKDYYIEVKQEIEKL